MEWNSSVRIQSSTSFEEGPATFSGACESPQQICVCHQTVYQWPFDLRSTANGNWVHPLTLSLDLISLLKKQGICFKLVILTTNNIFTMIYFVF